MMKTFPKIAVMEKGIFKDRIIILCWGWRRAGQKYSWIIVLFPGALRFATIFSLEFFLSKVNVPYVCCQSVLFLLIVQGLLQRHSSARSPVFPGDLKV